MKKVKQTKAQLRRKVLELESQLAHAYHFASATIDKAGPNLMGSGVVLQLSYLGGANVFSPVCIKDGLSLDTIAALKSDLVRSFELTTMYRPAPALDSTKSVYAKVDGRSIRLSADHWRTLQTPLAPSNTFETCGKPETANAESMAKRGIVESVESGGACAKWRITPLGRSIIKSLTDAGKAES